LLKKYKETLQKVMRCKILLQDLHHPSPQWKTCICRFFYVCHRCDLSSSISEKTV